MFLIAIKIIFPSAEGSSSGLPAGEEPFIVPLAIPLVAGPTILATLMLLSHQYPNQMSHLVIALLIARAGRLLSCCSRRCSCACWVRKGERAGAPDGADSGDDGNADVPGRDPSVDERIGKAKRQSLIAVMFALSRGRGRNRISSAA